MQPAAGSPATAPRLAAAIARRLPFYYGWLIAGVAFLSAFLGAGLNNISMAVILRPLSEEAGWSRSLMAGAIGAGNVAGGLLSPLAGSLADRFGPRLLLPVGAVVAGGLVLAISFVSQPWHFYATYVPARAIAETLLVGVVPMTAIANWFQRQRPRVMGLVVMAVPLGASALVVAYQFLITQLGWRWAFVGLAVLLWAGLVAPGALLLLRRPEDLGMAPDGAPVATGDAGFHAQAQAALPPQEHQGRIAATNTAEPNAAAANPAAANPAAAVAATLAATAPISSEPPSWTLREAARTPALWLLTASSTLSSLATGGTAFNLAAYFTDAHIDQVVAAGALSVFALAGAIGAAFWGLLAERVPARLLNLGILIGAAGAMLVLLQVQSAPLAYGFAVLFGLTARAQGVLIQVLLAEYFGRGAFGAISGLSHPFVLGGLGLGPLLAALVFDLTGSYTSIFAIFGALFLTAAALMIFAQRPTLAAG